MCVCVHMHTHTQPHISLSLLSPPNHGSKRCSAWEKIKFQLYGLEDQIRPLHSEARLVSLYIVSADVFFPVEYSVGLLAYCNSQDPEMTI